MPPKQQKTRDKFNTSANQSAPADRKRRAPYSLRLSKTEREYLQSKSGHLSLHAYIRARIFDDDAPLSSERKLPRVNDTQALSKVLGALGRSNIANNLNQIAKAANAGTLALDHSVIDDLYQAVSEVANMRADLIRALGLRDQRR